MLSVFLPAFFTSHELHISPDLFQMLQQTQGIALQLAQMLDSMTGKQLAPALAEQFQQAGMALPGSAAPGAQAAQGLPALGGDNSMESSVTKKARTRAAESTSPR